MAGELTLLTKAWEKQFQSLRGGFVAGHVFNTLHFFIPSMSFSSESLFTHNRVEMSFLDLAGYLNSLGHYGEALLPIGLFVLSIAFVVVPFLKPLRAVFIAGAVLGVMYLVFGLTMATFVEERGGDRFTFLIFPFSQGVIIVANSLALLGFFVIPPASVARKTKQDACKSPARSESLTGRTPSLSAATPTAVGLPSSADPDLLAKVALSHPASRSAGQSAVLVLSLGVTALIIGYVIGFASKPPLEVSCRDSLVPGGGRVLIVQNTGPVRLQDCKVWVKGTSGQSYGPKGIGSLSQGEKKELGWAELDGWVLAKGETIWLSCKGCGYIHVVVP